MDNSPKLCSQDRSNNSSQVNPVASGSNVSTVVDSDNECNLGTKNPLKHTLSPGCESLGDSCYDSDADASPTSSRRNSSHGGVSRTTSDTLGTELEKDDIQQMHSINADETKSSKFTNQVEFALRLGYTEEQIGSVFELLGTDIGENDLLSALINLGTEGLKSTTISQSSVGDRKSCLPVSMPEALRKNSSGSVKPFIDKKAPVSNLRPIIIDGSNVAMR